MGAIVDKFLCSSWKDVEFVMVGGNQTRCHGKCGGHCNDNRFHKMLLKVKLAVALFRRFYPKEWSLVVYCDGSSVVIATAGEM